MAGNTKGLFEAAMDQALAYREAISTDPQLPTAGYRALRDRLALPMPEEGTNATAVIKELSQTARPGLMPMAGARFLPG